MTRGEKEDDFLNHWREEQLLQYDSRFPFLFCEKMNDKVKINPFNHVVKNHS